MFPEPLSRRHLARFDQARISHRFTDVLVVGSGIAGLSASLSAARVPGVEILLIAKAALHEGSTHYAQGGVAAVLEPDRQDDHVELHERDTLQAACGLARPEVVRTVVREGVEAVRGLLELGARFDRHGDGQLHFTREGGHGRARILHSADSTGREIEHTLLEAAAAEPRITALEKTFAIDLVVDESGCCRGVLAHRPAGRLQMLWAKQVILATGGAGRLYRETTNPPVTTGDGLAMAFRAGATLENLEFVQFHPTTLYVAGADRFLITEAARGEGGRLVDVHGEAFMREYHPDAELAPRDVVSRAILDRMKKTDSNRVYLDLTGLEPALLEQRFPRILEICQGFGIDARRQPIPVRPSAHYTIGGVRVDLDGATDVPHLLAVGEVSSTGLHGANRLGSNSLLEGLVFGRRAGRAAAERARSLPDNPLPFEPAFASTPPRSSSQIPLDLGDLERSLQSLLWHRVGIERDGEGLELARHQIETWISYVLPLEFHTPEGWTLQNMLTTSYLILLGARAREESRGVHYRADFPALSTDWERPRPVGRLDLVSGKRRSDEIST